MITFKQFLKEAPKLEFDDLLYHGHNEKDMKENQPYPYERKYLFATDDSKVAGQYGRYTHIIRTSKGLKKIDLTDHKNHHVVTDDIPEAAKHLKEGTLWRNKPLERKVLDHLFNKGYQHIALDDQEDEEGYPSISYVIHEPHKNAYVGYRK